MSDTDSTSSYYNSYGTKWRLKQLELTKRFRKLRRPLNPYLPRDLDLLPVYMYKSKNQVHHGRYALNNINHEVFRRSLLEPLSRGPLIWPTYFMFMYSLSISHKLETSIKSACIPLQSWFAPNRRRSVGDLRDDKRQYSEMRIKEVSRALFALDIRFRRIISCGGMGMAALFEVQNRATGLFNKVVAKIALKEDYNRELRHEKRYLKVLAHDKHILQVKNVQEIRHMTGGYASEPVDGVMPANPSVQAEPSLEEQEKLNAEKGIMLTEYMPYGTLGHWIGKAVELDQEFSNEACWRMLLCMAKACQSLESPPSSQAYAEGHKKCIRNIVHFDLDPSNILVDGTSMAAHASSQQQKKQTQYGKRSRRASAVASGRRPRTRAQSRVLEEQEATCPHERALRLKLADFGLAQKMDDAIKDSSRKLWMMRTCGKERYLAPEQWTAEWDAVFENPVREGMEIAGAYSSKTNLYQVGLAMMCIMMRTYPEPTPRLFYVPVADYSHAGYRAAIGVPNSYAALPWVDISTPAWILAQRECAVLYEPCLRDLVIRLTSYEPYYRPTPDELVAICEQRIAHPFDGDDWPPTEADWITTENMPTEAQPKVAYQVTPEIQRIQRTYDGAYGSDEGGGAPLIPYVHERQGAPSPEAQRGSSDASMMDAYDSNYTMKSMAQAALATRLASASMNSDTASPYAAYRNDAGHDASLGVTESMAGQPQTSRIAPSVQPSPNIPLYQIPGRYLYAAPSALRGDVREPYPGQCANRTMQGATRWGREHAIEDARAKLAAQIAQETLVARQQISPHGFYDEHGFVYYDQPTPAPAQFSTEYESHSGQAQ